jgi:hypothetical protein
VLRLPRVQLGKTKISWRLDCSCRPRYCGALSYLVDDAHVFLICPFCARKYQSNLLAMATKKTSAKRTIKSNGTSSYGKKSDPPRGAVKEMMAKQSQASSKDTLHRTTLKPTSKKLK